VSPLLAAWCGVTAAIVGVSFSAYWSLRGHRYSRAVNLEPHYAALLQSMDDFQVLVHPDVAELVRRYKADDVDPVKRETVAHAKRAHEETRRHLALLGISDGVACSYQHWVDAVNVFRYSSVSSAFLVGDSIDLLWKNVERENERTLVVMREHIRRLTNSVVG